MEWCIEDSGLPLSEYDRSHPHLSIYAMHPTPDHSKKFAEEVILPFIRG
jgi:hypothetical protein